MQLSTSLLVASLCTTVLGAPLAQSSPAQISKRNTNDSPAAWDVGAVREFPIHESCNVTQTTQLRRGLEDAVTLASHARDHVLRYSNESALYRKYFGDAPSAQVIGNYERIVSANKANLLFRCDDVDGNCQQSGWAGHWRGENATSETVICDLSFSTRLYLEEFCAHGYTVVNSKLNTYFGTDLMHRLYHIPAMSEGNIEHFADEEAGFQGILDLAKNNATFAPRDSDSLQYFAADAYAYDIAVPGVGCSGEIAAEPDSTSTPAQKSSTTMPPTASETGDAPSECHTHADGEVHCQ